MREHVIQPVRPWSLVAFREIWARRDLVLILAWRDIQVRYKQTVLGAAWAILQPVLLMLILGTVFGSRLQAAGDDVPVPVFLFAGLLPWSFFASAVSNAANSVVLSERLITKVYFPRMVVPLAAVTAALVDFALAWLVLIGLMLWYGISPSSGVLLVAPLTVVLLLAAVGVGTLLAALNVAYRDFRYVVTFLMQIWLFATPSVYMEYPQDGPSAAVADSDEPDAAADASAASRIFEWNPMTGLIASFRNALLGRPLPGRMLAVSLGMNAALFCAGCWYFFRVEDSFADIV